jgi:arginine/ornithine N-succinyltransferase beta subunit
MGVVLIDLLGDGSTHRCRIDDVDQLRQGRRGDEKHGEKQEYSNLVHDTH